MKTQKEQDSPKIRIREETHRRVKGYADQLGIPIAEVLDRLLSRTNIGFLKEKPDLRAMGYDDSYLEYIDGVGVVSTIPRPDIALPKKDGYLLVPSQKYLEDEREVQLQKAHLGNGQEKERAIDYLLLVSPLKDSRLMEKAQKVIHKEAQGEIKSKEREFYKELNGRDMILDSYRRDISKKDKEIEELRQLQTNKDEQMANELLGVKKRISDLVEENETLKKQLEEMRSIPKDIGDKVRLAYDFSGGDPKAFQSLCRQLFPEILKEGGGVNASERV